MVLWQIKKYLLQISVREPQNDTILPGFEGGFSGARTIDRNICIGYKSLRKYTPKNMKPMIDRNNITCGCETCISAMLLQSDLNKWRISKLAKIDKVYRNYASTRLL